MKENDLTVADVLSVVSYCPVSGLFTWKWRAGDRKKLQTWNSRFANKPCSSINASGYLAIMINGKSYLAHRLAWLVSYGENPDGILDHINRNRSDNRLANLRIATHSQNMQNRKMQKNNKSGYRGVSWDEKYGKWRARISSEGKCINLGYFDSAEKASFEFEKARMMYHSV
ncbi:HNH endonuclease [Pantoea anthophila]|uniref:HNH endonuclease n=1 Tax=Pantoea anthophila TaxID=470931 RepID=UPI003CEEA72A